MRLAAALAVLLAAALATALLGAGEAFSSEILFRPARLDALPYHGVTSTVGDLNGDGTPDLVAAGVNGQTGDYGLFVLLGEGNGTFVSGFSADQSSHGRDVELGDFDEDGDLDVALTFLSGVQIWLGQGDGTLVPGEEYHPGSQPGAFAEDVEIADFDRDGHLDLVVSVSYEVSLLFGRGDGTFEPAVTYPTADGGQPNSVSVGDLDRDGVLDIVYSTQENVGIWLGTVEGTFVPGETLYTWLTWDVEVGDVTGDQIPDLLVARNGVGVAIHRGLGDGTFMFPYHLFIWPIYRVTIGDLNRDDRLDVVVSANRTSSLGVHVFLGQGDGAFSEPAFYTCGPRSNNSVVEDLNADGLPDLLVDGVGLSVLFGSGGGELATTSLYPVGDVPRDVVIADLDGDEVLDVVTVTTAGVEVRLGPGDGSLGPSCAYPAGTSPSSAVIGRFDPDPVPDVVVANTGSDDVTVLHGVGDGSLLPPTSWPVGEEPRAVATADLDGDGTLDLAVAYASNVAVLLGQDGGGFAPPVGYEAGDDSGREASAVSVAIGNLDGDEIPDLAVGVDYVSGNDHLATLLGHGDGTFGAVRHWDNPGSPRDLAIHDVDRDGIEDLVVMGYRPAIFLGRGGGTFLNPILYEGMAGLAPLAFAIGDVDGDGRNDLAVARYDQTVSVLLARPDGSAASGPFRLHGSFYGVARRPVSMGIGDLNDDGSLDLVVANDDAQNLAVLLGVEQQADPEWVRGQTRQVTATAGETRLHAGAPSPFVASTTLRFDLASTGVARLEIFDVRGRHVRTLVDGRLAPGRHAPIWDGRDGSGRAVAAGVYFVRLETGTGSTVRKVVRAR